jgi:hypothetical protein
MNERKSSYSQGASNCVEVGDDGNGVLVGDTKDPRGPRLPIGSGAWQAMIRRVRDAA